MDELMKPKKLKVIKKVCIVPGIYNDFQGNPTTHEEEYLIKVCPNCEYDFFDEVLAYYTSDGTLYHIPKHCPNCGQALMQKENGK